jgi:hypothetical protein
MYFKGKPLYPFGYGLSYTSFEYSNLKASREQVDKDGEITISVQVRNTGSRTGDEVVQMYVAHNGSKVEQPIEPQHCAVSANVQCQMRGPRKVMSNLINLHQKRPRLRLPMAEYQALRNRVLERDGWHCQFCATSNNLHFHHLKSRSRLGDDTMRNLITLCTNCHEKRLHHCTTLGPKAGCC